MMADLPITPANVKAQGENTRTRVVLFGEAMAAGDSFFYRFEDNVEKAFQAHAKTVDAAFDCRGVVLTGAAADGWGVVCEGGLLDVGATLVVGMAYILSTNAGRIAPVTDFSGYTGVTETHIGYAAAVDQLDIRPFITGAVIP